MVDGRKAQIDANAVTAYIGDKSTKKATNVATLNIRNLPDAVHARLRVRAAEEGRSMEAEARDILATACRPKPDQAALD